MKHAIRQLPAGPWAMHPDRFRQMAADTASIRVEVERPDHPPRILTTRAAVPGREAPADVAIAVLPIVGVIAQRVGDWYGDTWTERLSERFAELVASETVAGIVLDVDSPGGIVSGTPELADQIFQARGSKPITAVVNSFMASAAYWIGSAADRIVITPSGEAGSIGVYSAHVDYSKLLEEAGMKVTFVHAGRFKVEGNFYEPLEQEARDEMQRGVDYYYDAFTKAVARNRGMTPKQVRSDLGEGRLMRARQAVDAGMVDSIGTLGETVQQMAEKIAAARGRQTSRKAMLRRKMKLA